MSTTFSEVSETFEFLDDWEDKYRYVIELGREYKALEEGLRTDSVKVDGCASQVWLLPYIKQEKFYFDGASDAIIVSGLVAILSILYNGNTIKQAQEIKALEAFHILGLGANLSAQRSNGLNSMIQRIETFLIEAS